MNMQASEKLFLQTVGRFVKQWTAPLFERLEKVERATANLEVAAALPVIAFTPQQETLVKSMIDAAVANALTTGRIASLDDVERVFANAPPGPAGPPGENGRDGKDGKDVDTDVIADVIQHAVATEVAKIPAPRDGRDGTDGIDGKTVSADDLRVMVTDAVADAVAALPAVASITGGYIDRAGDLFLTNSSGGVLALGHVVGKDADQAAIAAHITESIKAACEKYPPPKDGKDGFSLTDFTAEFDGERTLVLRFASGEAVQEYKLVFPVTIYRGVWREQHYWRGDSVTLGGSQWIALADTDTRPGTPNCDWQLAVKKGQDGKEGKRGPAGEGGKPGRDGRDLTQMGFDGRKY